MPAKKAKKRVRNGAEPPVEDAPELDVGPPPEPPPSIDMTAFDDEIGDAQNVGDIVVLNALRIKALQAKGIDTRVARCRVERWRADGSGKVRLPGEFSPDEVTVSWLKKRFGVGKYGVTAFNNQGSYLAYGTAMIAEDAEINDSAATPVANHSPVAGLPAASGGNTFAEQLLLALLPAMFQQRQAPPAQDDSLRETMSAMGKMMAMQLQMQTANALKANGAPDVRRDETLAILKTVLEQAKPAPAPKQLGLGEFLPLLNMGMSIGSRMAGGPTTVPNPNGEKQLPPWLEVLPGLADTIGVPLIATIAQSVLPKDTAEAVLKLMTEHLETRKLEAEAEAAAADAVDTEGAPTP